MTCSTRTLTGLVVIIVAALAGGLGQAATKTALRSASPSGGEALRAGGNAELSRERLAALVRDYRGPDPLDFQRTEGEIHEDDEEAAARVAPLALQSPSNANGAALPESPHPITSWKAMDALGGIAGDATIAVSTTHVLVTNRATLRYFDKSGTVLGTVGATSLFLPLGLNDPSFMPAPIDQYFDMRSLFDPYRKRFWVMALGINSSWRSLPPAQKRHVTAVAVSKTENPADGWYLYWWDSVPHWGVANDTVYQTGDASDYPTIGIDAGLFHETHAVNNYTYTPKTFRFWRVTFYNADQMAAGLSFANVQSWQFWDLQNPDGSTPGLIQAVVHHTASPYSFYVSRIKIDKQTPGNVVVVWALTKPFQAGQKMVATSVSLPVDWLTPADANQPIDEVWTDAFISMTNLGTSPLKAVFRNDLLYFVTNDAIDPYYNAVRYVRLLTNTYPTIVLDGAHKFISRTFGVTDAVENVGPAWAGWPGVEVNKSGNAAIVFSQMAGSIFPQVRFATYYANEPDIRLSRLLKDGEATYHDGFYNLDVAGNYVSMPWGDTAGTSVDPKDDTGIWMAQQYSTNTSTRPNYAIWVGKVFGALYFDLVLQNVGVETVDSTNRQLTVSGQVHNGGDGASPDAQVSFYLVNERSTTLLGTLSQGSLRPAENGDFRTMLPLPRAVIAGSYQLRAVVEASSTKGEYSTGNNATVVPFDLR